jgi:hypothetical protein
MALFTPVGRAGWYYPATLDRASNDPAMLARFRAYARSQAGGPEWDPPAGAGAERGQPPVGGWTPLGRGAARDAAARRQFYWSARFFPHDSARYFADATAALEAAFYPGLPVVTNWNFFAGRSYVPGPVANNKDKAHPAAAMGGHDWAEFARLRGGTMLWTEDWFGDAQRTSGATTRPGCGPRPTAAACGSAGT